MELRIVRVRGVRVLTTFITKAYHGLLNSTCWALSSVCWNLLASVKSLLSSLGKLRFSARSVGFFPSSFTSSIFFTEVSPVVSPLVPTL